MLHTHICIYSKFLFLFALIECKVAKTQNEQKHGKKEEEMKNTHQEKTDKQNI